MQAEMQQKQAQIQIKAQELQLKQQQHELEKAQLMLDAHKIDSANQLNVFDHKLNLRKAEVTHELDKTKAHHDFTAKIANILSDIHKHENPQKKAND
jgi:hypothetical protein